MLIENPEFPLLLVLVKDSHKTKFFSIIYKALFILRKLDPRTSSLAFGFFSEETLFPVFWKIKQISKGNRSYLGFSVLALGI